MAGTYLYMIHAGRGDSFILEEPNRFHLIDGGPVGYRHGSYRFAPYYQYVTAALRAVSTSVRPNGSVQPDTVFITHWHEDHYGGIGRLFDAYLAPHFTDQPSQNHPLVFNGPLIAPPLRDSADANARAILNYFPPPAAFDPKSLAGFVLGGPDEIRRSTRASVTALMRVWTIDSSPDNQDSLLMFHTASRMVLTGDSTGAQISQFLRDKLGTGTDDRDVSIFKVPHHGSLRNSQLTSAQAQINAVAINDFRIYWLLCGDEDPAAEQPDANGWLSPKHVADTFLKSRARQRLLDILKREDKSADKLKSEVTARMSAALTKFGQGDDSYQPNIPIGAIDVNAIAGDLLRAIRGDARFYSFIAVRTGRRRLGRAKGIARVARKTHIQPVSKDWTSLFTSRTVAAEFYTSRIAKVQLRRFYADFSARAYVISANRTYGHPASETISAIAEAAAARNQHPTLFVTGADAVDLEELEALSPDWANSLTIRYLAHAPRARLDPAQTGAGIDVDAVTEVLDPTDRYGRVEISEMLESGPAFPQPGLAARSLACLRAADGRYLALANGSPQLGITPVAFALDDWWTGARVTARDIVVTVPATGQSACLFVSRTDAGLHLGYYRPSAQTGACDRFITGDAAAAFLTGNPIDPAILTFQVEPVPVPAAAAAPVMQVAQIPHAAADDLPFSQFCADARLSADGPASARAALAAICGPLAFADLLAKFTGFSTGRATFDWAVDSGSSNVGYTMSPALTAARATLVLAVPQGTRIDYHGLSDPVRDARFEVVWGDEIKVTLTLELELALDLDLGAMPATTTLSFGISIAAGTRSYRPIDYLIAASAAPGNEARLSIGQILTVMLGGREEAIEALSHVPKPLLAAGLAGSMPGEGSYVCIAQSPLGRTDVTAARLLPEGLATPVAFPVGGVSMSLADIAITLTDARLSGQLLSLTASASTSSGTRLSLSTDLAGDGEIIMMLAGGGDLGAITALFAGGADVPGIAVPLAGALSDLTGVVAPGVLVRQASAGSGNYTIGGLIVSAQIDGLSAMLPTPLVPPAGTSLTVLVRDPFAATRSAAVLVDFPLAVAGSDRTLEIAIAVETLEGTTISVEVASGSNGMVTFAQAATALGLTGDQTAPAAGIPVLGPVLDALCLDTVNLTVSGGRVTEFSLALACDQTIEIVPDVIAFEGADLTLAYYDGGWTAGGSATLRVGPSNLAATFRLPRRDAPGLLAIGNPQEMTIADFLQSVGVPSIEGVPVVGTLGQIAIVGAEMIFGYHDPDAASISVLEVSLRASLSEIPLGPLTVSEIAVGIAYVTAAGSGPDRPAGTSFWIQGNIGQNRDVTLVVDYDNVDRALTGSLMVRGDATLGHLLSAILPAGIVLDAIDAVIGGLAPSHAEVTLDCSGAGQPRLVKLNAALSRSAALPVSGIQVSGLSLAWGSTQGASGQVTSAVLSGSVSIDLSAAGSGSDLAELAYVLHDPLSPSAPRLDLTMSADLAAGPSPLNKAVFSGRIDGEIVLFGIVHLTGLAVDYRPGGDPRMNLAVASAKIAIPLGNGAYTPEFSGKLTYCQVQDPRSTDPSKLIPGARATLAKLPDTNDGSDFLGIPYLKLTEFVLAMEWAFDLGRTVAVAGKVRIGSADVGAAVTYANGAAQTVVLSLDAGTVLSDLFAACLNLADWGAGLVPDLSFKGRLTYKAPTDTAPKSYEAACEVGIFGVSFDITGEFVDGKGTTLAGQPQKPIDIFVFSLTGPDGTKGPSLKLVSEAGTGARTYKLGFGVAVGEVALTQGTLSYTAATPSTPEYYAGSLRYQGPLPVLGTVDLTLSAAWSEATGFFIRDWPLDTAIMAKVGKAVDLNAILRRLSSKPGHCPPIELLQALSAGFKFSLMPKSIADGKVHVDAVVRCLVSVRDPVSGEHWELFNEDLTLSDATASVPSDFAGFLGMLAELALSFVERLIQDFLYDPSALARLLAVLGVKALGTKAVAAILCRNPPPVVAPPRDPSSPNPPWPPLPPFPPFPLPPFPFPPMPGGPGNNNNGPSGDGNSDKGDPGNSHGGSPPPPNFGATELAAAQTLLASGLAETELVSATRSLANAVLKTTSALRNLTASDPLVPHANEVRTQADAALVSRYVPARLSVIASAATTVQPASLAVRWEAPPALPESITRHMQLRITSPARQVITIDDSVNTFTWSDPSLIGGATVVIELCASVIAQTDLGVVPFVASAPATTTAPAKDQNDLDLDAAREFLSQGQHGTALADVTHCYANAMLKARAVIEALPGPDPRAQEAVRIESTGKLALQSMYALQKVAAQCAPTPSSQPHEIRLDWQQPSTDFPPGVSSALDLRIDAPFQDKLTIGSAPPPFAFADPRLDSRSRVTLSLLAEVTVTTDLGALTFESQAQIAVDIPNYTVVPPDLPVLLFWSAEPDLPMPTVLERLAHGVVVGLSSLNERPVRSAVDRQNQRLLANIVGMSAGTYDGQSWQQWLAPTAPRVMIITAGLTVLGDTAFYVDPLQPAQLMAFDTATKSVSIAATLPDPIVGFVPAQIHGIGLSLYFLTAAAGKESLDFLVVQSGRGPTLLGYEIPATSAPTSPLHYDEPTNSFFWMAEAGIFRLSKKNGMQLDVIVGVDGRARFGMMSAALGYVPDPHIPGGRLIWWDASEQMIRMCALDGTGLSDIVSRSAPVISIDYAPPT